MSEKNDKQKNDLRNFLKNPGDRKHRDQERFVKEIKILTCLSNRNNGSDQDEEGEEGWTEMGREMEREKERKGEERGLPLAEGVGPTTR